MSRPATTRSVMDKRPRIAPAPHCDPPAALAPAPAPVAPPPRAPKAPLTRHTPYVYKPSRPPRAFAPSPDPRAEIRWRNKLRREMMEQHRRDLRRGYFDAVQPENGAQMVVGEDEAAARATSTS